MLEALPENQPEWSAGLAGAGVIALHGDLAAVSTAFTPLYWAGRAHYDGHRLRHRIVVYDRATRERRACLDLPRYPTHELAFRDDGEALAIACGAYDGGYAFEGELLVWEWRSGALRRPLGQNREVMRVRWVDRTRLAVLLRPPTDEGDEEAFSERHGLLLSDKDRPANGGLNDHARNDDIEALGFRSPDPSLLDECRAWALDGGVTIGRRSPAIRDIARLPGAGEGGFATVDGESLLSLWSRSLEPLRRIVGEGQGVQVLRCGERTLVAAQRRSGSALYTLAARALDEARTSHGSDDALLRPLRTFDRAYLFSADKHGRILARDTGREAQRADLILNGDGDTLASADLGHFDVFNHALRLDGGSELLFLRGTPASQHRRKVLVGLDEAGETRELMPWDGDGAHLMDPCGCLVDDGALVMSARVYDSRPGKGERFIARHRRDGTLEWRTRWPYAPIAMAYAPAAHAVVVATLDGVLALLDQATGELRDETLLTRGGLLAPPTCIVVDGLSATVGTLDGRLVTLSLAEHT